MKRGPKTLKEPVNWVDGLFPENKEVVEFYVKTLNLTPAEQLEHLKFAIKDNQKFQFELAYIIHPVPVWAKRDLYQLAREWGRIWAIEFLKKENPEIDFRL